MAGISLWRMEECILLWWTACYTTDYEVQHHKHYWTRKRRFTNCTSWSRNPPSPYMYKYERNLAMLLALTLPISSTNPMFVTKYMNFEACSWYDPAWCCQTDKCSAAKTLSGPTASTPPSISTYQPVTTVPYLGMLWHGTALAHQALTDTVKNSCAA